MTISEAGGTTYQQRVLDFKRQLIAPVLEECNGNRTQAARQLGVNRTYLLRLIRDLGLKREPLR